MLLRSSSTPATGTHFLPFSNSPNRELDTTHNSFSTKHHSLFHDQNLSFSRGLHHPRGRHHSLTSFCYSTSSSFSELNQEIKKGFRRASSDSNLHRLASLSSVAQEDCFGGSTSLTKKFSSRLHHKTMLRTEPSFSIINGSDGGVEECDEREEEVEALMRTVTIGDRIDEVGSGDFNFAKKSMGLIEAEGEGEQEGCSNGVEDIEEDKEPPSPPIYLAAGLGFDGIDSGGSGGGDANGNGGVSDFALPSFDGNCDIEEYYKMMVDKYPCHPLFLSNYGQLLQSKGDLHGAEDYYHRATLADPQDGQILLQYAKLNWELHHDQSRAKINFQRAVRAAPQDSHVLGAYASFLWEIDDPEDEDTSSEEHIQVRETEVVQNLAELTTIKDLEPLELPPGLAAGEEDVASEGGNVEEYYKRMVDENPSSSLVLRNYAQFLHESKGDLRGAEEHYSRAILADPDDGEIKSQYAKLVWQLYHDPERASCYHEQAVHATPENSNVLAAYASFLWETEENEDDSCETNQVQLHISNEGDRTTANA